MDNSIDKESVFSISTEPVMEHSEGSVAMDDDGFQNLAEDWIPDITDENKPAIGKTFIDIESAFEYYKEYGRACGFDVRRSSERKDGSGCTVKKYFLCSRAGTSEKSVTGSVDMVNSHTHKTRRTVSTRCNCPAQVVLRSSSQGGFYIQNFVENHNHSFAGKGTMQFLRCSRTLTEFHKRFIFDAAKSNIGPSRAHAIFKSMIGSYDNVGATVVDFKNFSRDIKQYIGKHDADMIIQKFKDIQTSSDKNFKFEYKTDSENHLTHLFWADGVSRKNFEVFGDVVSFDATYRTNKYGMVFIPFIGIDNHWKSVTFAAALLDKENSESYTWACESFKKIFGDKLRCIITDQDPAMKIAIEHSFPLVKHRYCMWHIMKKFPAKLGTLFCAESEFMDRLSKFVWSDHATPAEFEKGWNDVISDFGLTDNEWLKEIYDIRQSWIPAYFNDEPMLGLLRTTSRSESSNFYFNHFIQKGDTLSEFYLCFQSAIDKQRNVNAKLNHIDEVKLNLVTERKIEKDASQIYTRSMFYKIQEEIIAGSDDMQISDMTVAHNIKTIRIIDPVDSLKRFEVSLNLQNHDLKCSCKLYTRVGYLCRHCFLLLRISAVPYIPRQHVNNRWLKKAEERFTTLNLGEISDLSTEEENRRAATKECWFEFQGCMSDARGSKEQISFVHQGLKAIRKHISEAATNGSTCLNDKLIENMVGCEAVDEVTILPPKQSNHKGCRKRIKSSAEKSIGGKKRTKRLCRYCQQQVFHDFRNCPKRFEEQDDEEDELE